MVGNVSLIKIREGFRAGCRLSVELIACSRYAMVGRTSLTERDQHQTTCQALAPSVNKSRASATNALPHSPGIAIAFSFVSVTAGGGASHLLPGRSRRGKYVNREADWIYFSARRGGNLRPAGGRRADEPPAGGPVREPAGGVGYSLSSGAPCTSRGCR